MTHNLSDIDLAYIAGFFDGEGSVTIGRYQTAARSRHPNHTLIAQLGNTDPVVVEWLHTLFGGSLQRRKAVSPNHKSVAHWAVRANKALLFLELIRPFIRMKTKQIDLAIEFQRNKIRHTSGPGNSISEESLRWRDEKRFEIRKLNGRNKLLAERSKWYGPDPNPRRRGPDKKVAIND